MCCVEIRDNASVCDLDLAGVLGVTGEECSQNDVIGDVKGDCIP